MRARRIWALLAVVAVLAMHGVQCEGAVVDPPHFPVAAPADLGHGSRGPAAHGTDHAGVSGVAATVPLHSAPDGAPAHGADLWTLCLAVFAALAFVSMAVLFRGCPALVTRGPPPWTGALRSLHRPCPAPDLARLCLLRI